MNESTSSRGLIAASAYARDAASNINSFQLYSGVEGRNAVIPIPMMPTRMSSLPGRGSWSRGSPRPLKRLSQAEGLKARRDVHWVWERVPTAAVLLRRRDDGRRSAAGPHRDGPVPSPRGRSDADRFVPGDRGVGMGGEAGHPDGPRQGRLGTDVGFRPPRESPPVRPDVPHRACDEVEADRLGHGEAEVLLVHETLPRPCTGPRHAESRDLHGVEPPHLRGQRKRSPRAEDVPRGSLPGDHRLRDAGTGRRDGPVEGKPRRHRRPRRPPPTAVAQGRSEALRGRARSSPRGMRWTSTCRRNTRSFGVPRGTSRRRRSAPSPLTSTRRESSRKRRSRRWPASGSWEWRSRKNTTARASTRWPWPSPWRKWPAYADRTRSSWPRITPSVQGPSG